MFKVDPTLPLPSVDGDLDFEKQALFNSHLSRTLAEGSTFIAARLNAMLPKDGSEAMTGPLTVPSVTAGSLHVTGTSALDGVVTGGALFDLSAAGASQIKFGNTNNSSNASTLDGYSDYITYTPTFTGFGTVANISIWSKRVGDTLYIRGRFDAGIATGVEARMTLGFNGTNANVNSDATKVPALQLAGSMVRSAAIAAPLYTLIESNVGYITFGRQDATFPGFQKRLGNDFAAAGQAFSITAEVPISGW